MRMFIRPSVLSASHNSTIRKVNLTRFEFLLVIPSKLTFYHSESDKDGYFKLVADARRLQARFTHETGIDVVSRVARLVAEASGLPVRVAQEGDREYFAGLLRMINSSALIHADYAPYVS